MKRIGLFGGTFDPPHLAHINVARIAFEQMNLDQVFFIPCKLSPHKEKTQPVSAEDRLKMISIATVDYGWAEVLDIELQRNGLSYSIDTVNHLREQYPDSRLFWIMGSDQWEVLETWYQAEDLAKMMEFVVFPRPELPQPKPGTKLHVIDYHIDISSSRIRELLSRHRGISKYLHPEVENYISAKGLYLK
ncbi:MAG: nicotinate (nicotinamide) nucleotide adenylyltransferase [Verrucomicrobiota bacterium]